MQIKTQSPLCEHCGYNENIDNLPHQLPVGTILHGQYQVGKALGQGGFGITYIGWDTALDNPVAIKEYYPASVVNRSCLHGKDVIMTGTHVRNFFYHNRDRFLQEARVLARLRDIDGIVRVLNLFEENNTAYIVMEYVQGIDLRKYMRLQGGRLSAEQTFAILRPVMDALQKVHEAELVHRDISPDNIMVQKDGSVKLLDFGAAREVTEADAEREIARSTEAILKFGFAPIEQYQKRGSLGPWTDVYALCATIYYCLTGKVPPEAPERMADDVPMDWASIPGLTAPQIEALEQGMALRAKDRTASVGELRNVLYSNMASSDEGRKKEKKKKKTGGLFGKKKEKPVQDIAEQEPEKELVRQEPGSPVPEELPPTENPYWSVSGEGSAVPPNLPDELPLTVNPYDDGIRQPDIPQKEPESREPEKQESEKKDTPERKKTGKTQSGQENGSKKKRLLPAVLLLLVLAAGGWFLFSGKKPAGPVEGEPQLWMNNVLMADDFLSQAEAFDEEYLAAEGVDFETACGGVTVFGSDVPRNLIRSVTVLDTLTEAPETAWDVSAAQDGSVMAWLIQQESGLYDLYIGAEGGVNGREAAPFLFCFYSNVTDMDLSNLHTDEAMDMTCMFTECDSLTQLDLSGWNTASVTNMSAMFRACENLTTLDISGFDTACVTDMQYMFFGCSALSELSAGEFDTSSVVSYAHFMDEGAIFNGQNLETLFEVQSEQADDAAWKNNVLMQDLFDKWYDNETFGSYSDYMTYCDAYPVLGSDIPRSSIVSVTFTETLKNAPDSAWDVSDSQNGSVMAWVAPNGGLYDLYIGAEGGINAKNAAYYLFSNYANLKEIRFNGCFHTEETTDMSFMFNQCDKLETLNLSDFDTGNVINLTAFLQGCISLTDVDLSSFNTANVTGMVSMFNNCCSLEKLDVSGFDTSKVERMSYMFAYCNKLKQLDITGFDTSAVTEMTCMFSSCDGLENLDLSSFDFSNVSEYENFMDQGKIINGRPWEELFEG